MVLNFSRGGNRILWRHGSCFGSQCDATRDDSARTLPVCSRYVRTMMILGDDFMSAHDFRRGPISRRRLLKQSALTAAAMALPLMPLRVARAAGPLKPVGM